MLIQNKSCQTKAILGIENGKCCIFVSAFVDIFDMEAVNLGKARQFWRRKRRTQGSRIGNRQKSIILEQMQEQEH